MSTQFLPKEVWKEVEGDLCIGDETTKALFAPFFPGKEWISFPPGEMSKSRQRKEMIEDAMIAKGITRKGVILAVGGGVVLDLAGFVAATFLRGIPWIAFPTTLLAMVDAAIGGKVAVNTPAGKNLIGAFHPPKKVVCDLSLVDSMPKRAKLDGIAEMIKYEAILGVTTIEECIRSKEQIAQDDLRENGIRRILNFGHTIGHALEAATGYAMTHGEAIALGMVGEAFIGRELSFPCQVEKIETRLQKAGFALTYPRGADVMTPLRRDKKGEKGAIYSVVLERWGKAVVVKVEEALMQKALRFVEERYG